MSVRGDVKTTASGRRTLKGESAFDSRGRRHRAQNPSLQWRGGVMVAYQSHYLMIRVQVSAPQARRLRVEL